MMMDALGTLIYFHLRKVTYALILFFTVSVEMFCLCWYLWNIFSVQEKHLENTREAKGNKINYLLYTKSEPM